MADYKEITTSLGLVVPRYGPGEGIGAFTETANAPFSGNIYDNTANKLGSVTVDGHTYEAYHGRYNQSPTLWLLKDGVQYYESYLNVISTWSGFWCDIVSGVATVYWITCPSPSDPQVYTFPLPAGYSAGNPFESRKIVDGISEADLDTASWDKSPTTNFDDYDNTDPRGGEYADTDPFNQTDVMTLDSLPDPESIMNMSYSSFIGTYAMTATELQSVGDRIFSTNIWDQILNKLQGINGFNDCILSAVQIPVAVTNVTSGVAFRVGGVEVTGSSVSKTTTRYIWRDMGAITLKEVWGSARDYTDTSVSIFLPYVGMKEIDTDIAVNATMTLRAYIDIWTGDVLYLMHTSNAGRQQYYRQEHVSYRWSGNCGKQVQLGRVDNSTQLLGVLGAVAGVAVAGAGAAHALGVAGASKAALASSEAGIAAMKAGAKTALISGAVPAVTTGFKPIVQSSGGIAGSVGAMDYQKAYLVVKRAVPQYPNNWREKIGAPRYQTFAIEDLQGYTLFSDVKLDNMGIAVKEEVEELKRLLTTEGVIL